MRRYGLIGALLIVLSIMSVEPLFAFLVSKNATGEQKVQVIMVKFPDVEPSFSREMMRNKYFDKLDRYLRSVSNGKTWIKGKITDWYTLPRPVGEYRLSQHNLFVDNQWEG